MIEFGAQVSHFDTCTSTNQIALDMLRKGAAHGHVVTADHQKQGRGRLSRSWFSANEAIALSLILRPEGLLAKDAPRLVLLSAQAVSEALWAHKIKAHIKWPNDILIKAQDALVHPKLGVYRKVCGVLVELSTKGAYLEGAVIGIGINVGHDQIEDLAPLGAGTLKQENPRCTKEAVLATLLKTLSVYLSCPQDDLAYHEALERIRQACCNLNAPVRVDVGDESFEGVAESIQADGSLSVRLHNGRLQSFYAGDVTIRAA